MKVSSHQCNSTPSLSKSYMYFSESSFEQMKDDTFPNTLIDGENFNEYDTWAQVTAPAEADAPSTYLQKDHSIRDTNDGQFETASIGPLRENNTKKIGSSLKHVPHKKKPAQLVARRNLRERNRVQAVNFAFNRLRKAVPIQHARGKRISKVKTLQNAINYIRGLEDILRNEYFQPTSMGFFNTKRDSIWWDMGYSPY